MDKQNMIEIGQLLVEILQFEKWNFQGYDPEDSLLNILITILISFPPHLINV